MDGATKILKGDSVMSLITTGINLVGGIIIGMVQASGTLGEVAVTYSIATVGDGLVGQIPSLLISTATGMIVTRAVAEGSLNEDISKQFTAQPTAIMISGVVVAVLTVIPGMPVLQLVIVSAGLIAGGYYLSRRIKEEPSLASAGFAGVPGGEPQPEEAGEAGGETLRQVTEEEYFNLISDIYSEINSKIQFISVAEDAVFTAPKCRTQEQIRMLSKVRPKHLVERIDQFKTEKSDIYQFEYYYQI